MKAIISHDIDHITVSEHFFRDLIIPKFIFRMKLELLTGKISAREYLLRWGEIFKNKWQNIDELISFNNASGIPNSFFMAVNKGIGLKYSNDLALIWIDQMKTRNCEIGNHGICFENLIDVIMEKHIFSKLSSLPNMGIRMHYLKKTENTLSYLSRAGYVFDSSTQEFKNPYKIGAMWEFPIQIMDGWIIQNERRWQTSNLVKAKDETKIIINKAFEQKLDYITIVFHDRYFNKGFKTWLEWYMWLVDYLNQNDIEFINFGTACSTLNVKMVEQ